MSKRGFSLTLAALAIVALAASGARAATCTATGFQRDSINLTAAVIVTGAADTLGQTINATGCNIGIFYGPGSSGTVDSNEVYGANYFGVLVAGDNDELPGSGAASVDVTNNNIHDISESPLNGDQHGVGIYYPPWHSAAARPGRSLATP